MDWKTRINDLIASGLTIDEIASEMGVTPNAIREILAGRTKAPRAEAAMLLLEFCRLRETDPSRQLPAANGDAAGTVSPPLKAA